jgi:hypothetical protein
VNLRSLDLNGRRAESSDARLGRAAGNREEATRALARRVVRTGGPGAGTELIAVREAGLSDAEIIEVLARVAEKAFSDSVAILAQIEIDFPKAADELASVDEIVDDAGQLVLMAGCANQLGVIQREIVTLRMLDEVPGEDVAVELAISPKNVAVQLHRAKGRLREGMGTVTRVLQRPDETLS